MRLVGSVADLQVWRRDDTLELHSGDKKRHAWLLHGEAHALAAVLRIGIHYCDRQPTAEEWDALAIACPHHVQQGLSCRMALAGGVYTLQWTAETSVELWLGLFAQKIVTLYPPETVALARLLDFAVAGKPFEEA